jgi:hypothetical protein
MVIYYAEIPCVSTAQNHPIENTALKSVIKIFDAGIIIIFIGSALDQTYSNVITIPVRSAKDLFLIHTGGNLQDLKI